MTIALDAALSGLKAAQQALDVVSNNIANASTPGYTRKILPLETEIIQGVGHGVGASLIRRSVDQSLQRDLFTQVAVSQGAITTQNYLDRIQSFNGASDSTQALSYTISNLSKSFTMLADSPDSTLALNQTLAAAHQTASKFNDFSNLLSTMRNQAEGEISQNVAIVNQALQSIATLNGRIGTLRSTGASSADIEDQRDQAVRTVSQYLQVKTFNANNGQVFVVTQSGQALADTSAHLLSFTPAGNVLPTSYYPLGSMNGLTVDGHDITNTALGGSIGALFTLRDQTLPTYQAQIDEMAQKLAFRMDQQGLKLFTDASGNVPANTTAPTVTPYVGFSALIQVNSAIVADPTLIRSGTSGGPVLAGSGEVINRVAQYAFGAFAYQQATGLRDISAGTIFVSAGIGLVNEVIGNTTVTGYTPDLSTGNPAIPPGSQFTITVAGAPHAVTITAGDTAVNLVSNINIACGASVASLNGLGQIVLSAMSDISLSDVSLGAPGIAALGFAFTTYPANNPTFTVQAGSQAPVTITINVGSTAASLLAQLNSISGITASLSAPGGGLVIVPTRGGSLTLTDGIGSPLAGLQVSVANVAQVPFRQGNLGPGASLSTGLVSNGTLEDFARGIMTSQAEDGQLAKNGASQEQSFLQTLDKRNSDASGVNIDQELSNMIRIQSSYTAAAKMLMASERLLDELLNAIQ